jgi:cytochrome c biogenesis protein CcmG, thiol:disulfide interchange protein DsbE
VCGWIDRACGKLSSVKKRVSWAARIGAVALLGGLAGCGAATPHSDAPSHGTVAVAFKGSPPPLAEIHAQANQLIGGGPAAFEARLRSLRGHPVVVNMWASWCEPCQSEFPTYQRASVAYGRQVAFLGIDAKDHNADATAFLRKFPVTYPSYTDPHGSIASAIHSYQAYPQTFFFNSQGKKVFDKAGPYLSVGALERDIRRYVLT